MRSTFLPAFGRFVSPFIWVASALAATQYQVDFKDGLTAAVTRAVSEEDAQIRQSFNIPLSFPIEHCVLWLQQKMVADRRAHVPPSDVLHAFQGHKATDLQTLQREITSTNQSRISQAVTLAVSEYVAKNLRLEATLADLIWIHGCVEIQGNKWLPGHVYGNAQYQALWKKIDETLYSRIRWTYSELLRHRQTEDARAFNARYAAASAAPILSFEAWLAGVRSRAERASLGQGKGFDPNLDD